MRLERTVRFQLSGNLRRLGRATLITALAVVLVPGIVACGGDDENGSPGAGASGSSSASNVTGGIGSAVTVGDAVITVESLQAAFQPVAPPQRLSDEALIAPASGITFYQAYVHIENRGQVPLRVDPEDFFCMVGNTVSTLEPTRSGPAARSIIFGTSLDLLLTFRGVAGAEPTLIYRPSWYGGVISFRIGAESPSTSITASPSSGQTTTTAPVVR